MKQTIRLTENELKSFIKKVLNETIDNSQVSYPMLSVAEGNKVEQVFQAIIKDKQYINDMVNSYINSPEDWEDYDLSNFFAFAEEMSQEHDLTEDEGIELVNKLDDYIKNLAQKNGQTKKTNKLTESELRNLIAECINETMLSEECDEGMLGNMFRGMKNAFGNDVSKMGQAAKSFGNTVKNTAKQAGGAIKQGAQNVAQGASNRYQAAKVGYQTGQKNDKITKVMNDLQELQKSGILTGNRTNAAISQLMGLLKQAIGRNNSTATAFRNQI